MEFSNIIDKFKNLETKWKHQQQAQRIAKPRIKLTQIDTSPNMVNSNNGLNSPTSPASRPHSARTYRVAPSRPAPAKPLPKNTFHKPQPPPGKPRSSIARNDNSNNNNNSHNNPNTTNNNHQHHQHHHNNSNIVIQFGNNGNNGSNDANNNNPNINNRMNMGNLNSGNTSRANSGFNTPISNSVSPSPNLSRQGSHTGGDFTVISTKQLTQQESQTLLQNQYNNPNNNSNDNRNRVGSPRVIRSRTESRPHFGGKPKPQLSPLLQEKTQLRNTIQSLLSEVSHLKTQNQDLAMNFEQLRNVLKQTKSYASQLKKQTQQLTSELDFQSDLYQQVS